MLTSVLNSSPLGLTAQFGCPANIATIDCQPSLLANEDKQLRQVPSGSNSSSSVVTTPTSNSSSSNSSNNNSSNNGSRSTFTFPRNRTATRAGLAIEEVANYEKRIAFIQKEHEKMLNALHREVEQLKRKNKELQVQLVMRGFYSPAGAAEEEPEVKIVQLTAEDALKLEDQVMVEASMKQLQADLHEARSRNIYLNDLVEEQKRKIDEFELKESAAQIVKSSSTSFPLSPPFHGYMDDSSSSIRSYSSTLISTPLHPRSREDYVDRMKMQDEEIDRLEKENIKQRQELMEMRIYIERNAKLKFKGCNHPTRLLNRPRRQNTSPDYVLASSKQAPRNLAFRSSSMTQLPIINRNTHSSNARMKSRESLSRISFHEGLPPVLGRRSSTAAAAAVESSPTKAIKPPLHHHHQQQKPLNLAALRRQGSANASSHNAAATGNNLLARRLKLKQPVMMSKPTMFSNAVKSSSNAEFNAGTVLQRNRNKAKK